MSVVRCNAYGAEKGITAPYGGLVPGAWVANQPECHAAAAHRFRWVCEHGHRGPIIELCEWHYGEFTGARSARFDGGEGTYRQYNGQTMTVPWNIRRDVQVCYRCAAEAPECRNPDHQAMVRGRPGEFCGCQQHKCKVTLERVS